MKKLKDAELKMAAEEIALEMAKGRGRQFDVRARCWRSW